MFSNLIAVVAGNSNSQAQKWEIISTNDIQNAVVILQTLPDCFAICNARQLFFFQSELDRPISNTVFVVGMSLWCVLLIIITIRSSLCLCSKHNEYIRAKARTSTGSSRDALVPYPSSRSVNWYLTIMANET